MRNKTGGGVRTAKHGILYDRLHSFENGFFINIDPFRKSNRNDLQYICCFYYKLSTVNFQDILQKR